MTQKINVTLKLFVLLRHQTPSTVHVCTCVCTCVCLLESLLAAVSMWTKGTTENDSLNRVSCNASCFYATLQWMPLTLGGLWVTSLFSCLFWFFEKMYTQWRDGSWFISKEKTGLTFNFIGRGRMEEEHGERKGEKREDEEEGLRMGESKRVKYIFYFMK